MKNYLGEQLPGARRGTSRSPLRSDHLDVVAHGLRPEALDLHRFKPLSREPPIFDVPHDEDTAGS